MDRRQAEADRWRTEGNRRGVSGTPELRGAYNFSAGPATLPRPVARRVREELAAHAGDGASIIEISHKHPRFRGVLDTAVALYREVTGLPEEYHVLFVHGGARMQCAAVPLNLIGRSPTRTAGYVVTGLFAQQAQREGARYGTAAIVAGSRDTGFDRIPEVTARHCPPDAAFLHLTSNNTVYGTRWNDFPRDCPAPLVADATSDILSRRLDHGRFGIVYAGFQKNLGPSGMALVTIRDDLLGHALPETPRLLDYSVYAASGSLDNTPNTFAVFVLSLTLEWIRDQGGLAAVERTNLAKARLLYEELDRTAFYRPTAHPDHRSVTNIVFRLADESLTGEFLARAQAEGFLGLAGHRLVGGVRASVYNGMPQEGVQALADFLREFARERG
ncbi:3-phosphoserine/phosphohydroxythreonine transaminase [Streptomyces sp. WAC 06783]|uniref:3-phosphoserine/phosphohydroxythreonine transaminase n=1 Tax=Streptomyces sp. WAC 06783 TaxID=2203211 RepID=UPI000F73C39E|nr:3-phosphoserine/phosphohydroxythreonine transaminase [Streptomyces sp. WAC 06783]RSO11507.1 3-phosphoserine/phosphohydroxythreonine transaminase [Streptomyces sp. WAC 06783]